METIRTVFRAFKFQTLLIAIAAFVLGMVTLNYFLLSPGEAMVKKIQRNLGEMKESYVTLKSTDLSGIAQALQEEIEYLNRQREQIFSSRLSTGQIPLFISRLERDAEKAGLSVETQIVRQKEKTKSVAINLDYSGSIQQVLDFLSTLANRHEIFLVRDFRIYNPNSARNELNGEMQFISLLGKE